MEAASRKMGNARGVLIPKPILAQVGLEGTADLKALAVGSTRQGVRRLPVACAWNGPAAELWRLGPCDSKHRDANHRSRPGQASRSRRTRSTRMMFGGRRLLAAGLSNASTHCLSHERDRRARTNRRSRSRTQRVKS